MIPGESDGQKSYMRKFQFRTSVPSYIGFLGECSFWSLCLDLVSSVCPASCPSPPGLQKEISCTEDHGLHMERVKLSRSKSPSSASRSLNEIKKQTSTQPISQDLLWNPSFIYLLSFDDFFLLLKCVMSSHR